MLIEQQGTRENQPNLFGTILGVSGSDDGSAVRPTQCYPEQARTGRNASDRSKTLTSPASPSQLRPSLSFEALSCPRMATDYLHGNGRVNIPETSSRAVR